MRHQQLLFGAAVVERFHESRSTTLGGKLTTLPSRHISVRDGSRPEHRRRKAPAICPVTAGSSAAQSLVMRGPILPKVADPCMIGAGIRRLGDRRSACSGLGSAAQANRSSAASGARRTGDIRYRAPRSVIVCTGLALLGPAALADPPPSPAA